MHAITHTWAHRGTPATRTKARWQPYTPSRSPFPILSNTPSSTVSTPSSTQSCDSRTLNPPPRDASKTKHIVGLVDQTVKILCDVWLPHDIPSVFLTSSRPAVLSVPSEKLVPKVAVTTRNIQLPSPVSPLITPPSIFPLATQPPSQPPNLGAYRTNLAPMKTFVHEVLRRSKSSTTVLQIALCYLEAIRSKVPNLVNQEKSGHGVHGEPELDSRIVQGEVPLEDLDRNNIINEDAMDTAQEHVTCALAQSTLPNGQLAPQKKPKLPSPPLPPLPPLPSPLLCPRRTFLASLILASKFTQDRCYSNRAWAKISGLPPREIGRCERALGEALEWRLWVGKLPTPAPVNGRSVSRSRSEADVLPVPRVLRRSMTMPSYSEPAPPPPTLLPMLVSEFLNTLTPLTTHPDDATPPTPPLSFSPASTESSGGDRTIQMSSFMDFPTPSGVGFKVSPPPVITGADSLYAFAPLDPAQQGYHSANINYPPEMYYWTM